MAKKAVWRDNTMPPTNYLWLKIGPSGEKLGLFEWNGFRWVKISTDDSQGGGGAGGTTTATNITFHALDGQVYTISGIVETDYGAYIIDDQNTDRYQFFSKDYVTNNYVTNEALENALNNFSLEWIEL